MKPFIPYSLLAAFAACGLASAQTATTTPVGYITIGNSADATDNIPAETDVIVSIPLLKSAVYTGGVDSVNTTTNEITLDGTPGFTVDQWIASPHVLVVEDGAKSGLIAPITTNAAGSVIVDPGNFSLAGVLSTDSISIRPAWTISSFMAGASSTTGVQLLAFSNTQEDVNNSADGLFFNIGGNNWENGDGDPANDVILYPGEAFIIRTTGDPIADFVLSGEVPTANSYVAIGESSTTARDTTFGYVSPVAESLSDAGLGFEAGDILLDFDNLAAGQNKSATPYFYLGGGNWENADGDPANTFSLEGGKGYVYRRAAAASTGVAVFQDEPEYVPTLQP